MPTAAESSVIFQLSVLGALAQAAITVRWYEPPERDGETPTAFLEAGLFFVGFAVAFGIFGYVLSVVDSLVPPYGSIIVLLSTPVWLWLGYAAYRGQIETMREEAERFMGGVVGLVGVIFSVVLFAL